MVEIHVSIARLDPLPVDLGPVQVIPEMTTEELALVLGQVVDELLRRAVWTGPRPTVRLVPDPWRVTVGIDGRRSIPSIS